ncbi:MAG TPA: hypothetical protein VJ276_12390, partial [Thermoanaerobaculia bacterium]|nr:hypothetical protein [Thermoanaerobaculia bacterium]
LTMGAGAALAHNGGPGAGPGRRDEVLREGGADLLVGSSGTVYIVRESASTADTYELVGISSTGSTLFTVNIGASRQHFELSGSNLLSVASTTAADGTISSTITARSGSTSAVVWTRTLAGRVGELTPFNGGTYAVVTVPATTSGGTVTRSLVAIGNDGAVLWTVAL